MIYTPIYPPCIPHRLYPQKSVSEFPFLFWQCKSPQTQPARPGLVYTSVVYIRFAFRSAAVRALLGVEASLSETERKRVTIPREMCEVCHFESILDFLLINLFIDMLWLF